MEKERLNPAIVYVLAIIGIICCCLFGAGIMPSVIAFFIAKSGLQKAKEDPESYDLSSVKSMNTAKIIAIVAIVINILVIIRVVYVIYTVGWDELVEEFMREYQKALEAQQQNQ